MTGMLASVTSIAEAEIVLNEGVDILDLKNPHEGALGALDIDTLKAIVASVNGAIPISATVGDIASNDPGLLKTIYQVAETGVDIVKVGLFSNTVNESFLHTIQQVVKQEIRIVVVLFAEDYIALETYKDLLQAGITGIMLDTKNKNEKRLPDILKLNVLKHFVNTTKEHNLISGLAGSLQYEDVKSLLSLEPDYLGFRGALCQNESRVNKIDRNKVSKIRKAIPRFGLMGYDQYNNEEEVLKHGSMA